MKWLVYTIVALLAKCKIHWGGLYNFPAKYVQGSVQVIWFCFNQERFCSEPWDSRLLSSY